MAEVFSSVLIQDGLIVDISRGEAPGTWLELDAARLDLGGRTVIPGLWDSHIHLETYALSLQALDLELPSLEACLERVRVAAEKARPGEWILGHGWNQNAWQRYGSAADLDRVAPNNPVYLTAKSLHAAWVNSRALQAAGLTAGIGDPPDGHVGRFPDGAPNGLLFEGAMRLVSSQVTPPSMEALCPALKQALDQLLALGVTGVHDFDGPRCFQALQILREEGNLPLRVLKHIRRDELQAAIETGLRTGFGDDWLRLGNIKLFADGALGPRTAAMLEPYAAEPENFGSLLLGHDDIFQIGQSAGQHGLALAVHAIGDRANRQVLDAFEALRAWEEHECRRPLPHRIEHVQLLCPEDIPRVAHLDLVASMQPIHAVSDMEMAEKHWGPRARWSYAWRSLFESGAALIFGSDAPVEPPNPFLGLSAALSRQRLDGTPANGWIPQERLSFWEALASYTWRPAAAAHLERQAGKLVPGAHADLVILDEDLHRIKPLDIAKVRPVGVMIAGAWRIREF